MAKPNYYAALDLGTNNCRLLIAADDAGERPMTGGNDGLGIVDSFSRIVRLGEGVKTHGALNDEAMGRTLGALQICKRKLDKYPNIRQRLVATEACRRASNTEYFFKRVERELGLSLEVINNQEEAQLAFLGCSALLKPEASHAVVFDIGGGSTEFMWVDVKAAHAAKKDMDVKKRAIVDWVSIDSGVMNLAEHFGGNRFADLAYGDMVRYMARRLEAFSDANNILSTAENGPVQMLSTSGTVTTLAAVAMGLPKYDRTQIDGITLPVETLQHAVRKLLDMRPSERFNHGCIGADRADFILSGCAIFEAIGRSWPIESITIADRGVREGIILSLV